VSRTNRTAVTSATSCPFCVWPCEARCLVCGSGFCAEHGYAWARLCRRHRWAVWAVGVAAVGGLLLLRVLLRQRTAG
jgi:hypothetical protein